MDDQNILYSVLFFTISSTILYCTFIFVEDIENVLVQRHDFLLRDVETNGDMNGVQSLHLLLRFVKKLQSLTLAFFPYILLNIQQMISMLLRIRK